MKILKMLLKNLIQTQIYLRNFKIKKIIILIEVLQKIKIITKITIIMNLLKFKKLMKKNYSSLVILLLIKTHQKHQLLQIKYKTSKRKEI